jgi:hypothetical protein
MKARKLPLAVDEIDEDAKLLWLSGRKATPTDRVILYFHGKCMLIIMDSPYQRLQLEGTPSVCRMDPSYSGPTWKRS